MTKPSLPKGTRDFLPSQVLKRKYMFGILESVFQRHGFVPIETPSLELMQTLTGKYGEEGDRLLFKILNSGHFLEEADGEALHNKDSLKLAASIAKRGLRYDLTVPFARFVVMNRGDITFPFKRYQIQPVWRADRPQKGRYQEFYQCDCDVVGSKSLLYEADLISIYAEAFTLLGIDVQIKVNHRGVLMGIAEAADIADKFVAMTVCIDKLDKIGEEKVKAEMIERGIAKEAAEKILAVIKISDLESIAREIGHTFSGAKAIDELKNIFLFSSKYNLTQEVVFDPTLARGLSYYTGFITEVVAKNAQMGSLGGGGRYDNLTGSFGLPDVPGVGVSFGAERIFDVMEELKLFPAAIAIQLKVLVIPMSENAVIQAIDITNELRKSNINTDQYPDVVKLNKSMKYANDLHVPFVVLMGDDEIATGLYSLKNMISGEQSKLNKEELLSTLIG